MFSYRKLIVWVSLAAIVLATLTPIAPILLWALVVPLLLFSLLESVPAAREPDSIFFPRPVFVSLVASRAPPRA
jgi:hypothetical protein